MTVLKQLMTLVFCISAFCNLSGFAAENSGKPQQPRYGEWQSCSIGGGGCVLGVVICPSDPNRYYSFVDVGGCYRSDDKGKTWRMMHGALPAVEGNYMTRDVLVDPRDADRVLIAVGSGYSKKPGSIFLTTDGGKNFKEVLNVTVVGAGADNTYGRILVRNPKEPDTILLGTILDGVWKSTDNGNTWENKGLKGVNIVAIMYDKRDPKHIWLSGRGGKRKTLGKDQKIEGGYYESTDGGETWNKIAEKAPLEMVQPDYDKDTLYGLIDNRPVVSTDNGKTWEKLEDGLPEKGGNWMTGVFRALNSGPDFLLTGMRNGDIFRMNKGEKSWKKVDRKSMEAIYHGRDWYKSSEIGKSLNNIIIDSKDPKHWLFTDWYGIYQTHDSGANWKLTIDGMEITVIHCFEQDPSDPSLVHLGMADNGYFRSTDGGCTFTQYNHKYGISNNIKCISLSAKNPKRVYAVGPKKWHWEANQVYISDNKGLKWRRSKMKGLPDMSNHNCNTIVASPEDPDSVYLCVSGKTGAGGGIYHSTDGGDTWVEDWKGLPRKRSLFKKPIWHFGRELVIADNGNSVCFSGKRNKVFYRTKGDDWKISEVQPSGKLNALAVTTGKDPVFLAAALHGGLWKSIDGGKRWEKILDKKVYHAAIDRNNPKRMLTSVDGEGVYESSDGGNNWKILDTKLPYKLVFSYVGFVGDHALVGTDGSGAFWTKLKK